MLIGLTLCRSCVGDYGCCEFMIEWSYHVQGWSSSPLGLEASHPFLHSSRWAFQGGGDTDVLLVAKRSTDTRHFHLLSFCINHPLVHKATSLSRSESCMFYRCRDANLGGSLISPIYQNPSSRFTPGTYEFSSYDFGVTSIDFFFFSLMWNRP